MRLRRMLAFVLTLAMLMGNVTPAYAANTSVANTITGDVIVTTDENGNTIITSNPEQTPEVVNEDDEIMLITDSGVVIRLEVQNISILGRSTQGVTLMRTSDGGKVVSIARVNETEYLDKYNQ